MEQKIAVSASDKEQRLDKFISSKFSQFSRAFLKEQIKQGNFLVNDRKVKPSYVLRQGDQVALAPGFKLSASPAGGPGTASLIPNPDIKLSVIYEDDNTVVIDKPAGISVHPRQNKNCQPIPKGVRNTLANGLLARWPEMAQVGDLPAVRPGLVHRLDKDTSGVMIIAKNQKTFEWLKQQFQKRLVAKKYLALVHGQLKEKSGQIKCFLRRSPNPTKQQVANEGREAISDYKVIKQFKNYSLIEVRPETGRFHQIRVQFAWLGNPVVGDTKYGPPKARQKPSNLNRQFLHASELEILLPPSSTNETSNQKKTFNVPLPADLQALLKALEKT